MNSLKDFWVDLENKEFAHAYADEFLNILIATQIKVLRGNLLQEQLAQQADMKQERISLLENVNYSSWSVNTLRRLARAFDLRLRITFENFGTLIEDIRNLNAEGLKRKTRGQELKEFLSTDTSFVIKPESAQLGIVGSASTTAENMALGYKNFNEKSAGLAQKSALERRPYYPMPAPNMHAGQSQGGQQSMGARP